MLGKLTRQHKADGGLDLARRKGRTLGVSGQLASFTSNTVEDVVDERVHDGHALLGDAGVRVHLLLHLVDVDAVAFGASFLSLLVASLLRGLCRFLGRSLSHCRGWEGEQM